MLGAPASRLRTLYFRFIVLASVLSFLLFVSVSTDGSDPSSFSLLPDRLQPKISCSPKAYDDGEWVFSPRTTDASMTSGNDALRFSGFEGCASSREYYWHLAADRPEQWERFPAAQSWKWVPGSDCNDMRRFNPKDVVKHMVEHGGWLLVGDSVTENHFFSLSCLLYPHVLGFPDYVANPFVERSQIQHLYLNPNSPLVHRLDPPVGFNITQTPLVSFRRVDLLLSKEELVTIYRSANPDTPKDFELFSEEAVWTLPPAVYLEQFTAPLPEANYRTMVVSTAGHWTTTMFGGLRDERKKDQGYGIENVLDLFQVAMSEWATRIQATLHREEQAGKGKRRVLVRAYLPGHEDCHKHRVPWTEIKPFDWNWFNWGSISEFNKVFGNVLSARNLYPAIHFLPIDRPARLRPDAHASGDCLHIMSGAGVLEGWSEYIWHFITREV